jgi:predicted Zn-dependent protease with MMP-like domain
LTVTPAEFEQIALHAVQELPSWARDALENVILLFEDADPIEPDIYGIYDGVPLPDRAGGDPIEPARIHLYRVPLMADFGDDPAELAHEIRVTVLHEIAHHFGIDDDRLEELGYG